MQNPLLDFSGLPRFAEIRPEHVGPAIERLIADGRAAIECLAAELAAKHVSPKDVLQLTKLIEEAERTLDDVDRFTRSSLAFHLAVADASRNRVLHYQLVSLQHVSWPARNRTLTRAVALRVLEAHRQLAARIAAHDSEGARRLMDEHVRMIHGRRASERRHKDSFC